mmetsp:Transcript_31317/g.76398  ORF Transcript_31317/g.76398 Transcript_31317/m.76398 type:complete len:372 (-) Transcript_31317:183-1298(-)
MPPSSGRLATGTLARGIIILLILALSDARPAKQGETRSQGYGRTYSVNASSFTDFFEFFTSPDPTHGFVEFVNQTEALDLGMLNVGGKQIYMSVDQGADYNPQGPGRKSVRVQSRLTFSQGIFVIDLEHLPTGCGTWPAFWSVGPSWPKAGEIDILEGVHRNTRDQSTLHTTSECSMGGEDPGSFTGAWGKGQYGQNATDCDVSSSTQYANEGCGILSDDDASFGDPFNAKGGGVVATVWDASGIRMYAWPRGDEPSDISKWSNSLDPEGWSTPYARFDFGKTCNGTEHFFDHQLVFDLTLCGDWAGATFGSACPDLGGESCQAYVANKANVKDAYWVVNRVDVFEWMGVSQARPARGFQGRGCDDTWKQS